MLIDGEVFGPIYLQIIALKLESNNCLQLQLSDSVNMCSPFKIRLTEPKLLSLYDIIQIESYQLKHVDKTIKNVPDKYV